MFHECGIEHLNISPLADEDISDVFAPICPIVSVGKGACGTGVPARGDLHVPPIARFPWSLFPSVQRHSSTLFGVLANANNTSDAHEVHDLSQMVITSFQHGFYQRLWDLVRGNVLSSLAEQQQRTVVDNEQMGKSGFRRAVEFPHQIPKACARDLLSLQTHAHDGALGMRVGGRREFFRFNAQEVSGYVGGSERDTRLRHAPRAGIHPQQQRGRPQASPLFDELFMMWPGVVQGIGGVGHSLCFLEVGDGLITHRGQAACCLLESLDGGHASPTRRRLIVVLKPMEGENAYYAL